VVAMAGVKIRVGKGNLAVTDGPGWAFVTTLPGSRLPRGEEGLRVSLRQVGLPSAKGEGTWIWLSERR